MKFSATITLTAIFVLYGCASASVVPMSKNRVAINTRAAPICHTTGAVSVAQKMAAITTIRQGYERFVVLGYGAEDNTRVISTGPTYATTTGSFSRFGNTGYGTATTTFGGQNTFIAGGNNAEMQIVMLKLRMRVSKKVLTPARFLDRIGKRLWRRASTPASEWPHMHHQAQKGPAVRTPFEHP
jgi:hypothetical protein